MSGAPLRLAPLDAAHDSARFNSGSKLLNRYLREQVTQDIRRSVTAYFVALADRQRIVGHYTLASASLLVADLSDGTGKELPRHPTVPAVRMGRFAVDQAFKGQGLGGALLTDSLSRAARLEIAAFARDGGHQGRGSSGFLPASQLHRVARHAAYPVLFAGNHPAFLKFAVPSHLNREWFSRTSRPQALRTTDF